MYRTARLAAFAALLLSVPISAVAIAASAAVPFIDDDYPKALAEARARNLPIFLEAWAPWCHSCRSMQAYVYTDAKLAPFAERFVWLAIDTEKPGNAATVAKFPVGAWPSMYVIDPRTETVTFRWTGSATIEQLVRFLEEARAPAAGKSLAPDAAAPGAAEAASLQGGLEEADRLYGAAAWDKAATAYAAVIGRAPTPWTPLPRVADAYLFSLQKADRGAECAGAARELLPRIAGTPSSASVAAVGLDCAVGLAATAPGRSAAIADLERAARAALDDPALGIADDDRSGLYISLIGAREDAKDEIGKKRLSGEWIALLERAAAQAPTPAARAVFDSHRLSAYLEIGEPQRAIAMLEASERDFPGDYNPPARLAVAYRAMKEFPRALAASDRALARAYGPRRLGILRTRAKIEDESGDRIAARATLDSTLAEARALPPGQVSERTLAAIRKELEALASAAPAPAP
ncbi:MAG: thioredoxin family protein [Thermoanaerobaculia bacterium]|jgi:thiol-disulfide isomerase/thioredoxin|nr:thioredoxin family protein [Thermoanaerobaculia bacterium]MBP9826415.1 thioredoxin family protein [Thermoanaerobaculia bacterium]